METVILSPLVVEDVEYNGELWQIHKEFKVQSKVLNGILTVPIGFVTDFASIPEIVQPIISKNGPWDVGAVVHDFLYKNGGVISIWQEELRSWQELNITRETADYVMLEFMEHLNVYQWKRQAIFDSVRLFGRPFWKGN
jgi:hypothetical protein